ncbi:MAG: acyl-CoA dehydrogenase family protein [Thermoplasmata archaeon]
MRRAWVARGNGMDFRLSEVQALTRDMVREFVDKEVAPRAARTDEERTFPVETIRRMAELQLLGLLAPQESGGAGVDTITFAIAVEELARACASTARVVGAHNALGILPIAAFGSEEQKASLLPALASGQTLGTLALLDSGAGLDLSTLRTTAAREGDGFRITGKKLFVPMASEAGVFIVLATTEKGPTLFVVERGDGVALGEREELLGLRGAGIGPVEFSAHVPVANMIGPEGGASRILESVLAVDGIGLAAASVGVSRAAIEASVGYAKIRVQFGQPIAKFQAIQTMLAEMAIETEATRLLVYRAAFARDNGEDIRMAAAMARAHAADSSVRVGNKAVQVHGGVGYTKEMPVERYYRDAMALAVYPSPPDSHRLAVAAELLK